MNPALGKGLGSSRIAKALSRNLSRKDPGAEAGLNAGWYPAWPTWGRVPNIRRLQSFVETYGGSEDGIPTVWSCMDLIMNELAGCPFEIWTPTGRMLPDSAIPADLKDLLDQPNDLMTYFDFIQWKTLDTEILGNSYWVKDQMNPFGHPLALRRMRPEFVQIAVDDAGYVLGYVYHPPYFPVGVVFDRNEVIHFKRNPDLRSEYYGMGVIEGIQRSLEADLAESDHIIGFFSDGARLSGVLTTGTLSEIQFERFKQQFAEEYAGAANAHKILIAEEGTRFEPITAVAEQTAITELRSMTKNDILQGFGVPESMLGGSTSSPGRVAGAAIEQDQVVFSRRMLPRARMTAERLTKDLVSNWRLVFKIDWTATEAPEVKIDRAAKMLSAGGSINESRVEQGLKPYPEPWANVPVVPQGFAPFGFMTSGGAPSQVPVAPGGRVNGNQPVNQDEPQAQIPLANDQPMTPVQSNNSVRGWKMFRAPSGFEELDGFCSKIVDSDESERVLSHHVASIEYGDTVIKDMLDFYWAGQRDRLVENLGKFRDARSASSFSNKTTVLAKSQLSIEAIWHVHDENERLGRQYSDAVDTVSSYVLDSDLFGTFWEPGATSSQRVKDILSARVHVINHTLREKLDAIIHEGLRRSYSVTQITSGNPKESFEGVLGTFDAVNDKRVGVIARTESTKISNMAMLVGYKADHVETVEVADGTGDAECRAANGSVWTIAEAMKKPTAHASCVRAFLPVR